MAKKNSRKRTCFGKVRYRDDKEAGYAVRTLQNRSERNKKPHRAYYCHDCRGWHLSSTPDRYA